VVLLGQFEMKDSLYFWTHKCIWHEDSCGTHLWMVNVAKRNLKVFTSTSPNPSPSQESRAIATKITTTANFIQIFN